MESEKQFPRSSPGEGSGGGQKGAQVCSGMFQKHQENILRPKCEGKKKKTPKCGLLTHYLCPGTPGKVRQRAGQRCSVGLGPQGRPYSRLQAGALTPDHTPTGGKAEHLCHCPGRLGPLCHTGLCSGNLLIEQLISELTSWAGLANGLSFVFHGLPVVTRQRRGQSRDPNLDGNSL